jgi:hypothetical protein
MNATRDRQNELVSEMNPTKTKLNLFQHDHRQLCGNSKVPNGLEINKTFLLLCPLSFLPSNLFFHSFFPSFLPSFLSFFTNYCVCRRSNNTTTKTAGTKLFCGRRISFKTLSKTKMTDTKTTTTEGGREVVDERQPREEEEEEETPFQISTNNQP